jgi:integrase
MRIIPLNRRAKEILQELGGNIFGELNNALVTQKFLKLTNRLEMFDFKLHSLRHTFACRLIARGVDIYTVSKLLGHSDLKTTMVYAKVDLSSMQNAVNKLPHQPPTDILPPHE